mgnify:CR=1 FL=1
MLKDAISRARKALKEVQQKYSVESAAAVEQVYADIKNLNKFINKEIEIIDADGLLNDRAKSNERRKVLEQAGRKLRGGQHEGEDEDDSLFSAAYENVVFHDSTDDGIDSELLGEGPGDTDYELELEARRLSDRLAFLASLARLWASTAPRSDPRACSQRSGSPTAFSGRVAR